MATTLKSETADQEVDEYDTRADERATLGMTLIQIFDLKATATRTLEQPREFIVVLREFIIGD